MEKVSSSISLGRKLLLFASTGLLVLIVVVMLLDRTTVQAPALLAPVTTVTVVAKDDHNDPAPAGTTRFEVALASTPVPTPVAAASPGASPTDAGVAPGSPSPTPLPADLSVNLVRSAPAVTIAFPQTWDMVQWAQAQPAAHQFFTSRVFLGMMSEVFSTLRIRPEDLSLTGMKGESFEHLLREALAGNARIHYDRRAGKRGFVLSFQRDRTPLISRLLPVVVPVIARRQFAVPSLDSPIVEVLLGNQHLLVAEDRGRVFIANGLESLLRVLDQPGLEGEEPNDALTVTLHSEAFVDDLLPLLVGSKQWPAKLVLRRKTEADAPLGAELQIGAAKMLLHLSPKFSPGMFAAVPQGTTVALGASFAVPPGATLEDWAHLGEAGVADVGSTLPKEGGIAALWDVRVRPDAPFGDVAFVVVLPQEGKPAISLTDITGTDGFHSECGNGSVWLIASNEVLLTRMQEACERRSMSLLSAMEQGDLSRELEQSQLFVAVDSGALLEACFNYGVTHRGGTPTEDTSGETDAAGAVKSSPAQPSWKVEYERAVKRTGEEAEGVFRSIPVAMFYGRGDQNGARLPAIYRQSFAGRAERAE